MRTLVALVAAAIALGPTNAAYQPPSKAPSKAPPPKPPTAPKITESDRKTLMSLVDVLEVASLISIGDWKAVHITKKSRPLSNTAAAQAVLGQSDPKTRGSGWICKGDMAEYELVQKHREAIEKVLTNSATFGAASKDPVGYGDDAFRFASHEGKEVGILVASSSTRYDASKLSDVSRASKAATDLIVPLAGSLAEFSKPDAPPFLGVIVTYGLQSGDDPKTVQDLGESVALIWDAKSIAEFKTGKMSRKLFIHSATAYMTDRENFGIKKFDIKL